MHALRYSTVAFIITLALCMNTGCDPERDVVVPGGSDEFSLTASSWNPQLVPAAAPRSKGSLPEDFEEITSAVETRGVSMFIEPPSPEILHELELVYLTTGRIFDLADIYREVVDTRGVGHPMATRLAFLYARVGQQTAAETLAAKAKEAQPKEPFAWFVYGFALGQRESPGTKVLKEIEQAFSKTLSLDPEFSMPGGIQAAQIRKQRDALRQRIGGVTPSSGDIDP